MKKYLILILAVLSGIFLFSCKGDTGPAGAKGEDGKPLYVKMFQNNVYPDSGYVYTSDTQLLSSNPNYNYGSCEELYFGVFGTVLGRVLLKYDNLSYYIPANATVVNAQLVIYGVNAVTYTAATFQVYKMTRNWSEGTNCELAGSASWNTYTGANTWTSSGGDFDAEPISDEVRINTYAAYHTFNLNKEVVKNWIKAPGENYGMLIKMKSETQNGIVALASSEYGNISYRPKLVIYYTIQ